MKAWLYQTLNVQAKSWPYYRGDRAKQRQCIRDRLKTVRAALQTGPQPAYVSCGKGDNVLHYQPQPEGKLKYGQCSYSGFGDREIEMFKRLGLVVIDMRPADFGALAKVVISGPMIAVGDREVEERRGALSFVALSSVIDDYAQAGCHIHNYY